MKCQVCGAESGKYLLCQSCNQKRETGEVIKCPKCHKWHLAGFDCSIPQQSASGTEFYLYEAKISLLTHNELKYFNCIKSVLPDGYLVQAQVNLASFIKKNDSSKYQNELYRNVDFLILDRTYRPLIVLEVNDQSHLSPERRQRDRKVKDICEEAGIPVITLWTSYGINPEYIQKRITDALALFPVQRIHHFAKPTPQPVVVNTQPTPANNIPAEKKKGCYIATCIYGTYDCPSVWTLRRFRDSVLDRHWYGRMFIFFYYQISPLLIRLFGKNALFHSLGKRYLDQLVQYLQKQGFQNTPYQDDCCH